MDFKKKYLKYKKKYIEEKNSLGGKTKVRDRIISIEKKIKKIGIVGLLLKKRMKN